MLRTDCNPKHIFENYLYLDVISSPSSFLNTPQVQVNEDSWLFISQQALLSRSLINNLLTLS